jgi:hypothetical protein
VYFGYPDAHEDDAERAVRAGLDLISAVTALMSPVPLQARVGVSSRRLWSRPPWSAEPSASRPVMC